MSLALRLTSTLVALLVLPHHYSYPLITTKSRSRFQRTEPAAFSSQQPKHTFISTSTTTAPLPYTSTTHLLSSSSDSNNDKTSNSTTTTTKNTIKGVTLKMAFDSNPTTWSVSDLKSPPERFTSPSSLDLVHRLRRESDAVLVGCNTVLRDDCTLTVRRVPLLLEEGQPQQPVRVVVDPTLKVLKERRSDGECFSLLTDGYDTILYHALSDEELDKINMDGLSKHVTLVNPLEHENSATTTTTTTKTLPPKVILQNLSTQFHLNHIMVEGGPYTAHQFLQSKNTIVDRAIFIRAPIVFEHPEVSNINEDIMKDAGLKLVGERMSDVDVVEYWCLEGEAWPTEDLEDWP